MSVPAPLPDLSELRLSVVGLGYVGLPLAVEFGKTRDVVGFDINPQRIAELRAGQDATQEVEAAELTAARHLRLTTDPALLGTCTFHIVTVPTPISADKTPDLSPLRAASTLLAGVLKRGDIVVFESTVFPGATEEICVPLLEAGSALRYNIDFFCGYSPERINPGDKSRRLPLIRKVTSGSTPEVAELVDALYASIITAGTYRAESIAVAEAAKVIENTQRDLNIALVNELSKIFTKMGLDTDAVLRAAGTKWNFQPFRPGLVGGHCIGVDPYYLTHKAQQIGYEPEVILAGRRINDGMGAYVADRMLQEMADRGQAAKGADILVLGLTFKENTPDIRNTRVIDVITRLQERGARVHVHDPWASPAQAEAEHGLTLEAAPQQGAYDGVILSVAHDKLLAMGAERIRAFGRPGAVLFDVKSAFPPEASDLRL
ncbi:MAG: nucleotide sugar dehydrogenase [Pseudomonadota bacterium]